jgi:hypothetical protein
LKKVSHGVFTEFVYKFYGAIVKLRGRTLLVCAPKRLSKKVLEASGFTTLEHIVFTEKSHILASQGLYAYFICRRDGGSN